MLQQRVIIKRTTYYVFLITLYEIIWLVKTLFQMKCNLLIYIQETINKDYGGIEPLNLRFAIIV